MNDISTIDAGTFSSVYDQFHARVFRFFLKRATVHEAATELTQQLLLSYGKAVIPCPPPPDHSLEVQVFTMANSVWIDHLRKLATTRKYFHSVAEFDHIMDTQKDLPAFHAIEVNNYFRLAVDKLPPVRKKVYPENPARIFQPGNCGVNFQYLSKRWKITCGKPCALFAR